MNAVIRIVAAVVLDDRHRVLVVRKRGTTAFMQPGGKIAVVPRLRTTSTR